MLIDFQETLDSGLYVGATGNIGQPPLDSFAHILAEVSHPKAQSFVEFPLVNRDLC